VGAIAAGGAPAVAGDMLLALLTVPAVGLAAGQADIECELIHGGIAFVLLRFKALAALHAVALALGALYALLTVFAVEIFVIIIAPVALLAHKALAGAVRAGIRGVLHLALGRAAQKEAIPTLDAVTIQVGRATLTQSAFGAVYVLRQADLAVLAAVLVAVDAVEAGAAAVTEKVVAVVQDTAVAIRTGVVFQPTVCLGTVFAARAADAAHIVVPMVVAAGGTLGAVLVAGVDMKLHARQQREQHHDAQQPRQEPLSTRRTPRGRSVHFFVISSFHLSSSSFSGSRGTMKKIALPAAGMGDGLAAGMPCLSLFLPWLSVK